ncbi:MAG: hypothetical protein ACREIV_11880 [Planctomycetaceae bacterium]
MSADNDLTLNAIRLADMARVEVLKLNQTKDVGGSPRFTAKGVPAWPGASAQA